MFLSPASNIRQVPDHQELFLLRTGFSSLTFDIFERVTDQTVDQEPMVHFSDISDDVDQEALVYHFTDIVDETDLYEIWSMSGNVALPKIR